MRKTLSLPKINFCEKCGKVECVCPKPMHTIPGSFAAYINLMFKNIPIGPLQALEIQKAYYAGAGWAMTMFMQELPNLSDKDATAFIERLQREQLAFAKALADNGQGGMTDEPVAQSPIQGLVINKE